jgi:hypothetical protein
MTAVRRHEETNVQIAASADRLFAHLDDPKRLGAHMSRGSLIRSFAIVNYSDRVLS